MPNQITRTQISPYQAAALLLLSLIFFGCAATAERKPGVPPELPPQGGEIPSYDGLEEALRAGDSEKALELLEEYAKENPEDENARLFSASLLMSRGRLPEAREILEALLENNPGSSRALIQLALLEGWEGRPEARLAILSDLSQTDPENPDAWSALGDYHLEAEEPSRAAEMYARALELDPRHPDALAGSGLAMMEEKDYPRAEEFFDRYIQADQSDPFVYSDRARVRMNQGKIRAAEEDLSRAIELNPDYWNYIDRGKLRLTYLNNSDGALEDFSRAVEINPDFFYAYIYRAGIYDDKDRFDEAISDYKNLLRLNPEYTYTYKSLGVLQYMQGQWDDARKNLLEAHKYEDDTGLLFLAGYTYFHQGKNREGRAYFTDLMNGFPRDDHFYNLARTMNEPGYGAFVLRGLEKENDMFVKTRIKFYLGAGYDAVGVRAGAADLYREVQSMNIFGLYEWRIAVKALEAMGDNN